jgi:hypothetical protein
MSNKLDLYKLLINFQGLSASETKIKVNFGRNGDVLIASRLGDMGPWQAVTNHELEDVTDSIVQELIRSTMISASEAKQILEKPITDALVKEIKPVVSQIIEDSKALLRDLESFPVVKIHTQERTQQIEALLVGRIQPLLKAPVMEYLPQEEETLKKLNQLLEKDYPRLFDITKKYVFVLLNLMKKYDSDTAARTALGEAQLKSFKENCTLFKDGITFRQVRSLRPEPNEDIINKVMFEQKFNDADQMVSKLNS